MKRSIPTWSILAPIVLVLTFSWIAEAAQPRGEVVRVKIPARRVDPGVRTAILSVYASAEGGEPLTTETRTVSIDESRMFTVTPEGLAHGTSGETRWLGVRFPPGTESRRVALASLAAKRSITIHVDPEPAITAAGAIESTVDGFRFPDGSVQTSAATVSGGVPSVNGIGGAVTIAGGGTASVQTAANTITVTTPAFGTPVSIGSANAAGVASTTVRSDHVHAHGNLTGGTLHAEATTGSAGFLSAADKVKLDDLTAYVRTVVVSPVVGDAAASGTALLAALNGISGNSASSPFLLKIEPGVYDIGASVLAMKSFVDVEGSGENATFIVASHGGASLNSSAAAITTAASSELRRLTVSNTASSTAFGMAVFSNNLASLRHVTINSTGATTTSIGVFASTSSNLTISDATITATSISGTTGSTGVHLGTSSSKVTILNSRVTGKGTGGTGTNIGVNLSSSSATVTIEGSTILATGTAGQNTGVNVAPGNATIIGSTVQVETAARAAIMTSGQTTAKVNVFHSRLLALSVSSNASEVSVSKGNTSTINVATSQIDSASNGTPKCVHVYDADMDDLGNSCPGPIL